MMFATMMWLVLGVTIVGLYNGLLLLDDKTDENDPKNKEIEQDWHITGAGLFIYLAITSWIAFGFWYAPFVLSLFWLLFGGIVHIVGLNKHFFYVGKTAKTDRLLRKIFPKNPELGSAIIKISCFILSFILITIKN